MYNYTIKSIYNIRMLSQINLKIDEQTKKKADKIADKLGFSLSSIIRAFLLDLIRNKEISFSLNNTQDKTQIEILESELLNAGFDKTYVKEHLKAYKALKKAKISNQLTEW